MADSFKPSNESLERPIMSDESEKIDEAIARAELQKLRLEIEHLRNKSRWSDRVAPYTNLLSIVVAVSGFLFGIYQFQKQHQALQQQLIFEQEKHRVAVEREQEIKLQDQIRSDVEQLLQFTQDKQITTAKVSFLLSDLKSSIATKFRASQPAGDAAANTMIREVSAMLSTAVINECNFDERRDLQFLITVMAKWKDYEEYLKENPDQIEWLLDAFSESIEHIYNEEPSVIRTVFWDKSVDVYHYPAGYKKLSASKIDHFQNLIVTFADIFDPVKDKKEMEWLAVKFQAATCNPTLTKELIDVSFPPKSKPELRGCL